MADDQELIAVMERRFADLAGSIDESRTETRQRFDRLEGGLGQVEGRLGQVEGGLRRTDERLDRFETETRQRFDRIDEDLRHTHVRLDSMHGAIRQVAEGVMGVDEKLEAFRADTVRERAEDRAEVRQLFGQLDRRITALEDR